MAVGAIAAALILFAAGLQYGRVTSRPRAATIAVPPSMSELWQAWIDSGGDAVICFSSPLTTVVKQYSTPLAPNAQPLRLTVNAEQDRALRESLDLPAGGFLYLSPAISQSKMGEAVGSIALTRLLTSVGLVSSATQSRLMSWEDFRNHNLILLGHDEANRWLDPILSKLPIRMGSSPGDKIRRIINTAPEPGAPSEYFIRYPLRKDQSNDDYALVSMIAGLDGKHQLLLINGVNSEGTQMAMEYLSDPAAVDALLAQLKRKAPSHQGPWQFQLVLRTEVRDKVPTRAEPLVIRIL